MYIGRRSSRPDLNRHPAHPLAAVTTRCNAPMRGGCVCFRPRFHKDECACSCTIYGMEHELSPSTDMRSLAVRQRVMHDL